MPNSANHSIPQENAQQDSYETGYYFERYIKELFNKRFFTVQKWHKSEFFEPGYLPGSHSGPDLELILFGSRNYRFAVECKWRTHFKDGKIQWAKPHHLLRYQQFRETRRIPVFVAIGVGGKPYDPEELFVTPLDYISHNIMACRSDLLRYERKPHYRLYYDVVQKTLW